MTNEELRQLQYLGVLSIGETTNKSADAVGEVLFNKERMQKYFAENVKITKTQDSNHD